MEFNEDKFKMIYDLINKVRDNNDSTIAIIMNKKTSDKLSDGLDEIKRTRKVKIIVTEYIEDDIVYTTNLKEISMPKFFYEGELL